MDDAPENHVQESGEMDENVVMNTILFWMIVLAVLFMLAKYSDTIRDWLARLVSRAGIIDTQQHSSMMQDADIELNSP